MENIKEIYSMVMRQDGSLKAYYSYLDDLRAQYAMERQLMFDWLKLVRGF